MEFSLMYAEYIPALMSFIITLVWFCMAVSIPDEPPPVLIWSAMSLVVLGATSIFLLPSAVMWSVFVGQLVFSFFLISWMKSTPTFSRPQNHTLRSADMFEERVVGK